MIEKACFVGLPNKGQSASATLTSDGAVACSKTLECPTAVENKDNEEKGENLLALPATCKNLRHRRVNTKRSAVPAQHTNKRTCLVSVHKTLHRKTCATGSRDNTRTRKDPSIHVRCRFADAKQNSHDVPSNELSFSLDTFNIFVSQNAVQCTTTTDVTSHERRFFEGLVKTTFKTFSEPFVTKNIVLTFTHKSVCSATVRLRTSTRKPHLAPPDSAILRVDVKLFES